MNHFRHFLLLSMMLLILNGCGMAIKTVMDTAQGGVSSALFVEPIQNLSVYSRLEVVPFTSAIGEHISPDLLTNLNDKIAAQLSEHGVEQVQGGELRISGKVLHLQDDKLSKQIIVQVQFNDAVTNQSIGMMNIAGQANSIRGLTSGMDAVAASISETLVENHFANMGETASINRVQSIGSNQQSINQ